MLFVIGWFASGGDAPDYGASDQAWTNWADDNQWRSRIGGFSMLLAGFVFLFFLSRCGAFSARPSRRSRVEHSSLAQRSRAASIGIAGMTTAIVIISSATSEGQTPTLS